MLYATKDATDKLKAKYPSLGKVYPTIGNHEALPCDNFDLYGDQHQWILNDLSSYWRQWLTKDSQKSVKELGCYSQLHPGTNLRMLMLNPFVGDAMNGFLFKNATNPWHVVFFKLYHTDGIARLAGSRAETQ